MRHSLMRTIFASALLAAPLATSAGVSLSPIMDLWSRDKREIAAMLGGRRPYDEALMRQDLQRYITSASAVARDRRGGSAEARAFAARFDAFAADGRAALDVAGQPSAVAAKFDRMLADCRGCHAIFNN
jgi:cytochrome c556